MKCKRKYEDFVKEAENYKSILIKYKNTGEIFIDHSFDPNTKNRDNSKQRSSKTKQWKRIDEIYPAPLFQKELIKPEFVKQGELNDCYFICALSNISNNPRLVPLLFDTKTPNQIVGNVPDSIDIKCGAVVVYLFCFGKRTPVLIDTLIPVNDSNEPLYSCPTSRSASAWFCLVEKAFAKLNESYQNINWGFFEEAAYSLFGFFPDIKKISELSSPPKVDKMRVFERIKKYSEQGAVMSVGIDPSYLKVNPMKLKKLNLLIDHSYSVLGVESHCGVCLICIRNPLGQFEWNGDWSKKSNLWTPELKEHFLVNDDEDGTFWMDEKDFCKCFTTLRICRPVSPDWHCKQFSVRAKPDFFDGMMFPFFSKKTFFALKVVDRIPSESLCKFRIVVECRIRPLKNKAMVLNQCPFFTVMVAHLNGEKLKWSNLNFKKICKFNKRDIVSAVRFDVKDCSDVVTLAVYRTLKSIMVEDFFVTVYADSDFEMYNIDKPQNLLPEIDKNKSLFNIIAFGRSDNVKQVN